MAAVVLAFLPAEGESGRVHVSAAAAPEGARLSLHLLEESGETGPAVFAEVEGAGDRLVLRPSIRLSPGEEYRALLRDREGAIIAQARYAVPGTKGAAPRVVEILPSCEAVPANLLKFYLTFDRPMREGREFFDQVEIVDEAGRVVAAPWRRQELWSVDSRRLTLWIHPGRVKQGVNLREEMGPVLEPGRKYELRLSSAIRDADGHRLGGDGFTRSFRTTAEVRRPIDVDLWRLDPPSVATRAPLVITTDRALDPHLFTRHVRIVREGKTIGRGDVEWDSEQQRFSWTPVEEWVAGEYILEAGEFLEDLAGNTPVRAFDTDLLAEPEESSSTSRFRIAP